MSFELRGRLCTIRPWHMSDAPSLVRHANNVKVAQQLRDRFPNPYTRADAQAFLKLSTVPKLPTNFAIDVNGEAVGGVGYVAGRDVERYSAEIGYWLGEAFWRRGITTEALILATEYVFTSVNMLRLFALPFANNIGSVRVLEKAGYVREALLHSSSVKFGQPRDQYLFARINRHWRGADGV